MLIAIEGIDGAGKGTQAGLLRERLKAAGKRPNERVLGFPQYNRTFHGRLVGDYLNGRFGTLYQAHPMLIATLFAADRRESADELLLDMLESDYVVLDRYVASNIAHQTAKTIGDERALLLEQIPKLEYEVNQLPKADRTILLDIPVATAQRLVADKSKRLYTGKVADLHEANSAYLQDVRDLYLWLAEQHPLVWRVIPCEVGGRLRTPSEIADDVYAAVMT